MRSSNQSWAVESEVWKTETRSRCVHIYGLIDVKTQEGRCSRNDALLTCRMMCHATLPGSIDTVESPWWETHTSQHFHALRRKCTLGSGQGNWHVERSLIYWHWWLNTLMKVKLHSWYKCGGLAAPFARFTLVLRCVNCLTRILFSTPPLTSAPQCGSILCQWRRKSLILNAD